MIELGWYWLVAGIVIGFGIGLLTAALIFSIREGSDE